MRQCCCPLPLASRPNDSKLFPFHVIPPPRPSQGSKYVARLEGLYEDDVSAYLVQELCGGGRTLKALLQARGGRLAEPDAAAVMRGVLDVLCEAHRRDFVYGDVKPANFLVTEDAEEPADDGDGDAATTTSSSGTGSSGGTTPSGGSTDESSGSGNGSGNSNSADGHRSQISVRAVDFGCSRQVPLTKPCGSPLFMAPEMAHRRFGTAVDIWAAGVMVGLSAGLYC